MTTLLLTVTVFDDITRMAYSLHTSDTDAWTPMHQCEATAQAWWYLTDMLADSVPVDAWRISVIDRRPGTLATSRSRGVSLT